MEDILKESKTGFLSIPHEDLIFWKSIAKWTNFLSIVGFIFLAFMVLGFLSMGTLITLVNEYMATNGAGMGYVPGTFSWMYAVILILICLVYFFPVYYLFRFSTNLKKAIAENDNTLFSESIQFLQKHYLFIGILTIVGLSLMAISFFLTIAAMFSMI